MDKDALLEINAIAAGIKNQGRRDDEKKESERPKKD
jgi:hypothetical protein